MEILKKSHKSLQGTFTITYNPQNRILRIGRAAKKGETFKRNGYQVKESIVFTEILIPVNAAQRVKKILEELEDWTEKDIEESLSEIFQQ